MISTNALKEKFKKIIVKLICIFVPKKTWRHKIKLKLLPSMQPLAVDSSTYKVEPIDIKPLQANDIVAIHQQLRNDISLLMSKIAEVEKKEEINNSKWIHSFYNTLLLPQVKDAHTKAFLKFKAIHKNKDVVLLATGPTVDYYTPRKDAIHIGVNRAFMKNNVKLDYLFMQDFLAVENYIQPAVKYRPVDCVKFFGIVSHAAEHIRIPSDYIDLANGYTYFLGIPTTGFSKDISKNLMPVFASVIFSAISFALYTSPKRIFLVGCDCNDKGYFIGNPPPEWHRTLIEDVFYGWKRLKEFANEFYPEIEICSINPMRLRYMFRDVYTNDFLAVNPDVKDQTFESIGDV